jgi:hypothetical protein
MINKSSDPGGRFFQTVAQIQQFEAFSANPLNSFGDLNLSPPGALPGSGVCDPRGGR